MKVCNDCKEEKDDSAFSKSSGKGILRSQCRVCRTKRQQEYYLKNKEKINAYNRAYNKMYYQEHKEETKARVKKWKAQHAK